MPVLKQESCGDLKLLFKHQGCKSVVGGFFFFFFFFKLFDVFIKASWFFSMELFFVIIKLASCWALLRTTFARLGITNKNFNFCSTLQNLFLFLSAVELFKFKQKKIVDFSHQLHPECCLHSWNLFTCNVIQESSTFLLSCDLVAVSLM